MVVPQKTDVLEWKIHLSMDELGISILGNLHLCKFYGFYSSYDLDKYCADGYFSRWCFFFPYWDWYVVTEVFPTYHYKYAGVIGLPVINDF